MTTDPDLSDEAANWAVDRELALRDERWRHHVLVHGDAVGELVTLSLAHGHRRLELAMSPLAIRPGGSL